MMRHKWSKVVGRFERNGAVALLIAVVASASVRGQSQSPELTPPHLERSRILPVPELPAPHLERSRFLPPTTSGDVNDLLRTQVKLNDQPKIDPKMPSPEGMLGGPPSTPAGELPAVDMTVPVNQRFLIRPPGFTGELTKGDIAIDRPDILGATDLKDQPVLIRNKIEAVFEAVKLGVVRITFFLDSKDPSRVKTYTVRVVPDIIYLNRLVKARFPTANLNVVAAADNLLMVEGTVDNPADVASVERLLKHFFTGGVISNVSVSGVMQVQLEVVIVRVDRQVLRRLGVNMLFSDPRNGLGSQIGNLISTPAFNLANARDATAGAAAFNPIGGTTQALTSTSTLFFGVTNSSRGLFGFIEALRANNAAQVLANPTLVTYNGRTADFLVGGKQPIPTQGQNGIPVVQFEPFGTRLTFLPTMLGNGKIRLEVVPEVSTIDNTSSVTVGTIQVPRFIVQRLHATVELQSGQTLCLGGLLQTEKEAQAEKVPILGDLPGVGALFRRVRHRVLETELLVLITPRLFDPLQASQAPRRLPGQESHSPSDTQLFLNGILETRQPENDPNPPRVGDRLSESVAPYRRNPVPLQVPEVSGERLPPPLPGAPAPEEIPAPKPLVRGQAPVVEKSAFLEVLGSRGMGTSYPWR